ncbi:MAG: ribosome silencing factor [Porticoccaceae bacterium]|nr:ribosome silencing factor [Gammaproteobacteria bacterium]TAL04732.1 MAG: ribosome silencing factor [Porticoccaceae bacterium]
MSEDLPAVVVAALEDVKGLDIVCLDVRGLTDVTDTLVVASGNTTRQVKALAENVIERCRVLGVRPIGVEGMDTAEWVLVDLGDLVLHVMLPATRAFYELEKLWSLRPEDLKRGED